MPLTTGDAGGPGFVGKSWYRVTFAFQASEYESQHENYDVHAWGEGDAIGQAGTEFKQKHGVFPSEFEGYLSTKVEKTGR